MSGRTFADTVVIGAANNWDGVRMADRQLAHALADRCPVLYVDPPQSPVTHLRRGETDPRSWRPRTQRLGDRLARVTPLVLPGLTRPGISDLSSRIMARQVRGALRELGGTADVVVDSSPLLPLGGRCGERRRVYWAQDDYVGGAPVLGLDPARMAEGERRLVAAAEVVVAANPLVHRGIERTGREAVLIPYGCDAAHFATTATVAPAPGMDLPPPVVGFMGHLGERIDLELILAVARRGVSLLLIGPLHPRTDRQSLAALLDLPTVRWVGGQDFESLPSWLAHVHTGVLPYNHSPFNEGSFPLKTLEYLAAGIPVVASDLPAVRWLDCPDVRVADTPAEFADAVEASLAIPRDPDSDRRRRAFADRHSWDRRAAAFAETIGVPRHRPPAPDPAA